MSKFMYQAINYSRVPNQDTTLFILRNLAEANEFSGKEFINLNDLIHRYMFFGQYDIRLNYKASLKRFNSAALWLFSHGSIVLVGEEAVSLNHNSKFHKPSKSDIKAFKYALSLASYEFDSSVSDKSYTLLAHI